MTLRIEHLTIDHDSGAWVFDNLREGATDSTNDETLRLDLLSIVRHILRDEPCTIVPVVRGFVTHPVNRWGHNAQVEVTYSRDGWRAIYGAHLGDRVTKVTCYAD
jgi:hypothetical protein